MQLKKAVAACGVAFLLSACGGIQSLDANSLTSAGTSLYKAATLSDADIAALSNDSCKASDAESKVAPANSAYAKRLTKVMKGFGDMTLNSQKINYKVYVTKDVNAWAMGNGCVRVYSGLMDMMNDDELRGVIGHEMGHVALGHSKKAMPRAAHRGSHREGQLIAQRVACRSGRSSDEMKNPTLFRAWGFVLGRAPLTAPCPAAGTPA